MNTTSKNRRNLIGALAALALATGGTSIGLSAANASTTPPAPVTQSAPDNQAGGAQQPNLNGTIAVPQTAAELPDAQESAQLAAQATIDTKTAEAAAVAAVSGSTVVSTDLGDENGSLVYAVTVKDSAGAMSEVKIDAGNAAVLATEAGGDLK